MQRAHHLKYTSVTSGHNGLTAVAVALVSPWRLLITLSVVIFGIKLAKQQKQHFDTFSV